MTLARRKTLVYFALSLALVAVAVFWVGARRQQKVLAHSQNSLIRWVVDLHHTRRNGQSGFQSVTQLLGFTHLSHRMDSIESCQNKNNPEIASEIVFSPLRDAAPPIENQCVKYSAAEKLVKAYPPQTP